MKLLKDYKGVAIVYLVLTIFNVLWVINYDKPSENLEAKVNTEVVIAK